MTQTQAPKAAWRRSGFAIPLALCFCILIVILISATVFVRSNSKRQNKTSFQALKAHYIAQGAVQAALYKFRILPNEGYDATAEDSPEALATFLSDVGTESIPLKVSPPGSVWSADILEGKALNAVSEGYEDWLHVVKLTAEGRVQDGYRAPDGTEEERIEELVKTVEIRKERN